MNSSDQSTSEENFELGTDSRHQSSFVSKQKQNKHVESTSTEEVFDFEQESDFPQSVERTRYNQTNDESLLSTILDPNRVCSKESQKKNKLRNKNNVFSVSDNEFEISEEVFPPGKNKTSFSHYESSFDEKISTQTMDQKQFAESFEISERGVIEMGNYFDRKPGKSSNKQSNIDKNYFDSHIIEHENEQDEQREQRSFTIHEQHSNSNLIELQNPQVYQQNVSHQTRGSQLNQFPTTYENDTAQIKFIIRQKKAQLDQLKNAYQQTTTENEILLQRVKELHSFLIKKDEQNKKENQKSNDPIMQINQQHFKKTVKIFRKFSL